MKGGKGSGKAPLNLETNSPVIIFVRLCLSQWQVVDCGQPIRAWCQSQHTEASSMNARRSVVLDLPYRYGQLSSSPSMSLPYSIKKARISIISSTSSGSKLSFCSQHINHITSSSNQQSYTVPSRYVL